MVECVRKDGVVLLHQGGNHGEVGIEARLQSERCFHAFERRQLLLQLVVQRQSPHNTAHCRWSYPKALDGRVRRFPQARVVRQAKIIIGTQI